MKEYEVHKESWKTWNNAPQYQKLIYSTELLIFFYLCSAPIQSTPRTVPPLPQLNAAPASAGDRCLRPTAQTLRLPAPSAGTAAALFGGLANGKPTRLHVPWTRTCPSAKTSSTVSFFCFNHCSSVLVLAWKRAVHNYRTWTCPRHNRWAAKTARIQCLV